MSFFKKHLLGSADQNELSIQANIFTWQVLLGSSKPPQATIPMTAPVPLTVTYASPSVWPNITLTVMKTLTNYRSQSPGPNSNSPASLGSMMVSHSPPVHAAVPRCTSPGSSRSVPYSVASIYSLLSQCGDSATRIDRPHQGTVAPRPSVTPMPTGTPSTVTLMPLSTSPQ